MQATLVIDISEDGSMSPIQEYLEDAVRAGLDRQGFVLHNTTIERIADVAFRSLVFKAFEHEIGELIPYTEDDDVMTIEDFRSAVQGGTFIDYDGSGYYATELGYTREIVSLSYISRGIWPVWATHVAWFNR